MLIVKPLVNSYSPLDANITCYRYAADERKERHKMRKRQKKKNREQRKSKSKRRKTKRDSRIKGENVKI